MSAQKLNTVIEATPDMMLPMFNAVQNRLKATISAANTLLIEGYQIVHLEPSALTAKPVIIVANDPRLWQAVKDGRAVYYRTGTDDLGPYRVGQMPLLDAIVKWIERGH